MINTVTGRDTYYDHPPRLLFLNGWGMSPMIFDHWIQTLKTLFPALHIIIPSVNYCFSPEKTITMLLHEYRIQATQPIVLVGWSLGGILAQYWASHYPETLHGLVLCGTTPCFVQKENWPHGLSPTVFNTFVQTFQYEPEKTRQKFLFLQTKGDPTAKSFLQVLKNMAPTVETTDLDHLQKGLYWLEALDMRIFTKQITVPIYLIHGQEDVLIPVTVLEYFKENVRCPYTVTRLPHCGHISFWHREYCEQISTRLLELFYRAFLEKNQKGSL